MTLIERRTHEQQSPSERQAEHERIQQAAQQRIRDRIAQAGGRS